MEWIYAVLLLATLFAVAPSSVRSLRAIVAPKTTVPTHTRSLDAADPIDLAAMMEVDALFPSVQSITPEKVIQARLRQLEWEEKVRDEGRQQYLRAERKRAEISAIADYHQRLNAFLADSLGPGWHRRAHDDTYVSRGGMELSGESVRLLCP